MKTAIIIAKLSLTTGLAAQTCNFTTECFEGEACSETTFSMQIETSDTGTQIITDAETVSVSIGGSEAVRVYVGVTESAFHLLTHSADGPARYTTHLYDGPLMIGYLGECSE